MIIDKKIISVRKYSVKELAKLSGVSARTLQYYDNIDLLKPALRTEAGYRYYGERELLQLQQILFYKEMQFTLNQIKEILNDPEFDLVAALKNQKENLIKERSRMDVLISTIDKTILHLKKEKIMLAPEELYEGLNPETARKYRQGAIDKYGMEAVSRSENALGKMGKEGIKALSKKQKENAQQLFKLRTKDPANDEVQKAISEHFEISLQFWGKSKNDPNIADAYQGLSQLYLDDERFSRIDGKPQPEYARFLAEAMQQFTRTKLL